MNDSLQTAILSNVGTLVSFRVSSDSARHLEREFGGIYPAALLGDLGRGEAIVRLGQGRDSFRISTLPPPGQPLQSDRQGGQGKQSGSQADWIIEQTRATCCRPRREVEADLATDGDKSSGDAADRDNRDDEDIDAPDVIGTRARVQSRRRSSGKKSSGKGVAKREQAKN